MFVISKCKGESDLGQCMNAGLANKMLIHSGDFRRILRTNLGGLGKGDALKGACVPVLQGTFLGGSASLALLR